MDTIARAAFITAQAACAQATMMGMAAENQIAIAEGRAAPYRMADFEAVTNIYLIGHNAVIEYLRD